MEAMRLEIAPIRFLRMLGYYSSDKTICAALPTGAIFVGTHDNNVGATIGRPLVMVSSAVRHRDIAEKFTAIIGSALPLAASEWLPLEGKLSGVSLTDEVN